MPWVDGKNTWLQGLEGTDPVTAYAHIDVAEDGGSFYRAIQSGENNDTKDGIVSWGGMFFKKGNNPYPEPEPIGTNFDPQKDISEKFNLSIEEQRYQRCLTLAHSLAAQYPLDRFDPLKPVDTPGNKIDPNTEKGYREIVRREEIMTNALVHEIHKPENYGPYNTKGHESQIDPSTHDDVNRALAAALKGTQDIPRLSEFKSGETVCRHESALLSRLLTEAGVPNLEVTGNGNFFSSHSKNVKLLGGGRHTYVVFRLTGNSADATCSLNAYQQQVNTISMKDFLNNGTIIAGNESYYSAYGTGFCGKETFVDDYDIKLAKENNPAFRKRFHDAASQPPVDAPAAATQKAEASPLLSRDAQAAITRHGAALMAVIQNTQPFSEAALQIPANVPSLTDALPPKTKNNIL